jgi:hypothetical protein
MNIPISFIWIIILFDAVFKYGDGAKFWGYVRINAEVLCVEFCNFVQCHISVNYLTFAVNEWNIIKFRLPEIELLALVSTQLKFIVYYTIYYYTINLKFIVKEPTILLFETLFCTWERFNMGTELPTKVVLGQTLVLMQWHF